MDPVDEDELDFDLLDALVEQHQAHSVPCSRPQGGVQRQQTHQRSALKECVNNVHQRGSATDGSVIPCQRSHQQQREANGQQVSIDSCWGVRAQPRASLRYEVGNSSVVCGNADVLHEDHWQAEEDGWVGEAFGAQCRLPPSPSRHTANGWCDTTNGHIDGIESPPVADAGHGRAASGASAEGEAEEGTRMEVPATPLVRTSCGMKIHPEKAAHWVYPSQVPMREYQVTIVEAALFANTLCCLPTGLGKTMIAAVVMYNFYRWFPQGKIVFVAPTRPLVAQQVMACGEKTGLPDLVTQELTGNIKADERARLWESKRVFYCTPATLNNDVSKGICPMDQIVCLVIDECHRATGNHPIVQAIKQLREASVKFRILGLSATPGSRFDAVQEVLRNLMISRIVFRGEDDPDVRSYSFTRQLDVRVVSSSGNRELEYCRATVMDVQRTVLRKLIGLRVFWSCAPESVQRYSLIQAQERYRRNPVEGSGNARDVFFTFQQAIFLASTIEQLEKYGHCQAHEHVMSGMTKPALRQLQGDLKFKEFQSRLAALADSAASSPKLEMLERVVLEHFNAGVGEDGSTPGRVIIFTNLRESVQHIVSMLNRHPDVVGAKAFVGQGGGAGGTGMKQSEQKKTLQQFRNGSFNTLVATCIGEEGLDIPAVDLIVCFDGAASPTRNIQRMGRTGRHKEGRVVYILAEGKEEADYNRNQEVTLNLHRQLRYGGGKFDLFARSPRMVPRTFNPQMLRVDLTPMVPTAAVSTAVSEAVAARGRGRGRRGRSRGRGRSSRDIPPRSVVADAQNQIDTRPTVDVAGSPVAQVASEDELHDELRHALLPRKPNAAGKKQSGVAPTVGAAIHRPRRRAGRAIETISSSSSSDGERGDGDGGDDDLLVIDDSAPPSPSQVVATQSPTVHRDDARVVHEPPPPSCSRDSPAADQTRNGCRERSASLPRLSGRDLLVKDVASRVKKSEPPLQPSEHLRTLLLQQTNQVGLGATRSFPTDEPKLPEASRPDAMGAQITAGKPAIDDAFACRPALPDLSSLADDAEALLRATSDAPNSSFATLPSNGGGGGLLRRLSRLMNPSSCWALSTALATSNIDCYPDLQLPPSSSAYLPVDAALPSTRVPGRTTDAPGSTGTPSLGGRSNPLSKEPFDGRHDGSGGLKCGAVAPPMVDAEFGSALRDMARDGGGERELGASEEGGEAQQSDGECAASVRPIPQTTAGRAGEKGHTVGDRHPHSPPSHAERPGQVFVEGGEAEDGVPSTTVLSSEALPVGTARCPPQQQQKSSSVAADRRLATPPSHSTTHVVSTGLGMEQRLAQWKRTSQRCDLTQTGNGDEGISTSQLNPDQGNNPFGDRNMVVEDDVVAASQESADELEAAPSGLRGWGLGFSMTQPKRNVGVGERQEVTTGTLIPAQLGVPDERRNGDDAALGARERERTEALVMVDEGADVSGEAVMRGAPDNQTRSGDMALLKTSTECTDYGIGSVHDNEHQEEAVQATQEDVPLRQRRMALSHGPLPREDPSGGGEQKGDNDKAEAVQTKQEDVLLCQRRVALKRGSQFYGDIMGAGKERRDDGSLGNCDAKQEAVQATQDDVPLCQRLVTPRPCEDRWGGGKERRNNGNDDEAEAVHVTQGDVPLCQRRLALTHGHQPCEDRSSGGEDRRSDGSDDNEEAVQATQDDVPLCRRRALLSQGPSPCEDRACGGKTRCSNASENEDEAVQETPEKAPLCQRQVVILSHRSPPCGDRSCGGEQRGDDDEADAVQTTQEDVPLCKRRMASTRGTRLYGGDAMGAGENGEGNDDNAGNCVTKEEALQATQDDVPLCQRRVGPRPCEGRWGDVEERRNDGDDDKAEAVQDKTQDDVPLWQRLEALSHGLPPCDVQSCVGEKMRNDVTYNEAVLATQDDVPLCQRRVELLHGSPHCEELSGGGAERRNDGSDRETEAVLATQEDVPLCQRRVASTRDARLYGDTTGAGGDTGNVCVVDNYDGLPCKGATDGVEGRDEYANYGDEISEEMQDVPLCQRRTSPKNGNQQSSKSEPGRAGVGGKRISDSALDWEDDIEVAHRKSLPCNAVNQERVPACQPRARSRSRSHHPRVGSCEATDNGRKGPHTTSEDWQEYKPSMGDHFPGFGREGGQSVSDVKVDKMASLTSIDMPASIWNSPQAKHAYSPRADIEGEGRDVPVPDLAGLNDDTVMPTTRAVTVAGEHAIPETECIIDLEGNSCGKVSDALGIEDRGAPGSSVDPAERVDKREESLVGCSPASCCAGGSQAAGSGSMGSPVFGTEVSESPRGMWDFAQGCHDAGVFDGCFVGGSECESQPLGEGCAREGGDREVAATVEQVSPPRAPVAVDEGTVPLKRAAPGVTYDDDGFPKPTPKRVRTPDGGVVSKGNAGESSLLTHSSTPRLPRRRRNAVLLDSGGGSASPVLSRPASSQRRVSDPVASPELGATPRMRLSWADAADATPTASDGQPPKRRMRFDELEESPSPVAVARSRRARVVLETQESNGGGDEVVDLTGDDEPPTTSAARPVSSLGGGQSTFRRLKRNKTTPRRGGTDAPFASRTESRGAKGNGRRGRPLMSGVVVRRKRAKATRASCFFEEEADASQDASVSADEDDEDEDGNLGGFIVDSQAVTPCTAKTADGGSAGGDGFARRTPWSNEVHMHRRMLLGSVTPKRGRGWYARLMNRWEAGCAPSQTQPADGTPISVTTDAATHGDACLLCGGEEGELLLCDTCPACCHLECVGLRHVPPGEWNCPECKAASQQGNGQNNPLPRSPRRLNPPAPTSAVSDGDEGNGEEDDDEDDDDIPNFDL